MTDELVGKTIGGYEIQELVGRGGMATVYRAQQVSMKRVVAVKVLPKQYIHDDTYLQRFHQEVKIVSQLEHRNIVPVYDYGEYEGQPYIVMRYMSAGSVDDLIAKGPLEVETIISVMEQIGPALDYAHSKNVLHRDLKPSNVLMDDDGGAYLTDFGIARILSEQSAGITTQGVVGTPSYMSPEQAQGLALDNRSDIYALGVMLFEMATGRRPFESDTPYSIAVMQVTSPPPSPRQYNPNLSFSIEEVILKALKKKREDRYPHAVALAEALKRATNQHITSIHDTQPAMVRPTPPPAEVSPPSPQPMMVVPQIVYASPPPSQSLAPNPVSNYVRRRRPRRPNNLMNAAVGGIIGCGLLVVLAIVALLVISTLASGGGGGNVPTRTPRATLASGNLSLQSGQPTLDSTSRAARDTIVPPPTGTDTPESPPGTPTVEPVGVRTDVPLDPSVKAIGGSLVYSAIRSDTTHLYHLDLTTGTETQLTFGTSTDAYPAVSPDGLRVAFQSDRDGDFDIYVMDLAGNNLRQITHNGVADRIPSWSPNGEWLLFASDTRDDGTFDLYRARPEGGEVQMVYNNNSRLSAPRWSPDGRSIVFSTGSSDNAGTWEIGLLELAGDVFKPLTDNSVTDASPVFSPDGQFILFLTDDGAEGSAAIARMKADGSDRRIIYDGPGYEWGAAYSPDGRYIAFTSQAGEGEEIFVVAANGGEAVQVTSGGGQYAAWVPA